MKILFIAHEATRTGAPIMLLYFLEWLKEYKKNTETHLLLIKSGDLEQDFKNLTDKVYIISTAQNKESYLKKIGYKLLSCFGYRSTYKTRYINMISKNNYDIIYGNCAPTLNIAFKIKEKSLKAKLLLHVHELEVVLKMHLSKKDNKLSNVDEFIAASALVKNNLVSNWNIEEYKIHVVYECFNNKAFENLKKKDKTFVVGASGSVQWRKGDDIFLQVARYINKHYPEAQLKFSWVGANYKQDIIEEDLRKLNLKIDVDFVNQQKFPEEYYKEFSVFLMTSREDPFPLVCIEVANLEKPIICFEGATGTEEILQNGGGKIVPYLDIEAMSECVIQYYNTPETLKQDGYKAKQLFSEFTPDVIGSKIFEIIEKLPKNML